MGKAKHIIVSVRKTLGFCLLFIVPYFILDYNLFFSLFSFSLLHSSLSPFLLLPIQHSVYFFISLSLSVLLKTLHIFLNPYSSVLIGSRYSVANYLRAVQSPTFPMIITPKMDLTISFSEVVHQIHLVPTSVSLVKFTGCYINGKLPLLMFLGPQAGLICYLLWMLLNYFLSLLCLILDLVGLQC